MKLKVRAKWFAALAVHGMPLRSAFVLGRLLSRPRVVTGPLIEVKLERRFQRRFTVRSTKSDAFAVVHNLVYDHYQPPVDWLRDSISRFIRECDESQVAPLIIDVGAHIGTSVVYFENAYPSARIVAFEPHPENFEVLQRNVASLPSVDARCNGVAGKAGELLVVQGLGDSATALGAAGEGDGVGVPSESIGSVLEQAASGTRPFILKVDAEGAESEIFSDDACWTFPFIVMEPHDWRFPGEERLQSFLEGHVERRRILLVKSENLWSIDPACK